MNQVIKFAKGKCVVRKIKENNEMPTLAEQIRIYVDRIDAAASKENQRLKYCYIDISTATTVGETSIRIFPAEGRNKFFTDAKRDVKVKLGLIYKIIGEAKSVEPNDRIRIIISREYGDTVVRLRRYVTCDKKNSEIVAEVMEKIDELANDIRYHDVGENYELFSRIKEFREENPSSNLHELGNYLKSMEKNVLCQFDSHSDKLNLKIQIYGKNYQLGEKEWQNIN